MLLRDVEAGDVEAYLRMRCDPTMMADLGGPLPRASVVAQVERDVHAVAAGRAWIRMIVPEAATPAVVAGTVTISEHPDEDGTGPAGEVGWMVLPEFQRRGLGRRAVHALLTEAGRDGRWGLVHAFPGVDNVASNAICRSLGFRLRGTREVEFAGRLLRTNHWTIAPAGELGRPPVD